MPRAPLPSPPAPEWRWVDLDGSEHRCLLRELANTILDEALPPYVLVWRSGWLDWLPAYLVPELADVLGVESAGVPTAEEHVASPPPPPLEWYQECVGPSSGHTLLKPPSRRRSPLRLDWGESFGTCESPTVPGRRLLLPVGAFRDIDAYLDHLRARRGRR